MEERRGQRRKEQEEEDEKLSGRDESGEMALVGVDGQVRAGTRPCALSGVAAAIPGTRLDNGTPEERGQHNSASRRPPHWGVPGWLIARTTRDRHQPEASAEHKLGIDWFSAVFAAAITKALYFCSQASSCRGQ